MVPATDSLRHLISPCISVHHPAIPPAPESFAGFAVSLGAGVRSSVAAGYAVSLAAGVAAAGAGAGLGAGAGFGAGITPSGVPRRAISTLRVINLETSQARRESTWLELLQHEEHPKQPHNLTISMILITQHTTKELTGTTNTTTKNITRPRLKSPPTHHQQPPQPSNLDKS